MNKITLSLFLFFILNIPGAIASDSIQNLNQFSEISILHEGRVKPLESYALSTFKKISNNKINDINKVTRLLAETIFTPEAAISNKIFYVYDPYKYGLEKEKSSLYSYKDILPIIEEQKDALAILSTKATLTPDEKSFITLAKNQMVFAELLRSLTGLIPIYIDTETPISFLDLKNKQNKDKVLETIKEKNGQLFTLNEDEQINIINSFAYETIKAGGRNNINLKVIKAIESDEWFAPWEIISRDNEARYHDILEKWQNLAISFRNNESEIFNNISTDLSNNAFFTKITFEKYFNHFKFLNLSLIAFILSFSSLILSYYKPKAMLLKLPLLLFTTAIIFLTLQILGRIFIMERPPVGTLYESIIFVSWIVALNSLLVTAIQKNKLWISIGSISTVILLSVSYFFAKEDDMQPLVAVLNSNFWLTTHVLIITAGYGLCLIASAYAHFMLWLKPSDFDKAKNKSLLLLCIISLFLITFGTILGGLWADQSWGRFWGWDPKENGALLILLWISWLLHARLTHYSTDRLFAVGVAFLSIIVSLAWFGVNLLNVGLHSYGFTNGIFWGLVIFCALESIVISALYFRNKNEFSTA